MRSSWKRGIAGLLAVLMCFSALLGLGKTQNAEAATSSAVMIAFPREGDVNSETGTGTWGHTAKTFLNGWEMELNSKWIVHAQGGFTSQVCYCIEPGVDRRNDDTYESFGEDYWDNYPSEYNDTIEPDTIKLLIGRIMLYGFQGNVSTGWRTQNEADADKLAHNMATQILVWETMVGERDADFNLVDTGGKDTVRSCIASGNPLYDRFKAYYDSMEASVKSHTVIPSFMSRTSGSAKSVALSWNGSEYTATLKDGNGVLGNYAFTSDAAGVTFEKNGNELTIRSKTAPKSAVLVSAEKSQERAGLLIWSDGRYGPGNGIQDVAAYAASTADPVKAFLKAEAETGSLRIVKTSEDGKVEGVSFTVKGKDAERTVKTDKNGEIRIDDLEPGSYTVTEETASAYEPQEAKTVTVEGGKTAEVSFRNTLRKGDLRIVKTSEDGKVSGVSFRVTGNGAEKTVKTGTNGEILVEGLLPGTYAVKEVQEDWYEPLKEETVTVEYGETASVTFRNTLKRGDLKVTKSAEDGLIEGITFRLSGTAANGSKIEETAVTDAKGVAVFRGIPVGTGYTVEETGTKVQYVAPESQTAVIKWNEETALSFDNALKRGDLEITKTAEDGLAEGIRFHLAGTALNGDRVDLYAVTGSDGKALFRNVLTGSGYTVEETGTAERYVVPEKKTAAVEWKKVTKLHFENVLKRGDLLVTKTSEDGLREDVEFRLSGTALNGEKVDVTQKTGPDGTAVFRDILIGTEYTVEEVGTKEWYVAPAAQSAVIEWGKTAEVSFENLLKRGDLEVTKIAEDGLTEGVTFRLTGTSDSGAAVDETAVTDEEGKACFRDIPVGKGYTVEEAGTASRYVVPEAQEGDIEWGKVTSLSFENVLKKFSLTVRKTDRETGTAQGDAALAGALYGLYDGEELVETYRTDEEGSFRTGYFPCGDDWTLREIEPSEGYLLNEEIVPVGAEPGNFTVEMNDLELGVAEDIVRGRISILKHCDNGETGLDTPEEGAEFALWRKSAGSFEEAPERERDILVCDETGYAESKDLPYGTYTVRQTSGWDGRELSPDFEVFISGDGEVLRYLLNNAVFESFLKVEKLDGETGQRIPCAGAGFRIFDPEGEPVTMDLTYPEPVTLDVFYTGSDGTLITPKKLPYGKGYSLVEVKAPQGYVLDGEPVFFDVTEEAAEAGGEIRAVRIEMRDAPQKGILSVIKTGEVFASVRKSGSVYIPVYEERGLAGAVYEVRAAEDVVTPDGTVRLKAGETADTFTTGEDGVGRSRELYLGKYTVREKEAPYGMVLDTKEKTAELLYAGQEVTLAETHVSVRNERQKAFLSLIKEMEEDTIFGTGGKEALRNVTFGLYAAETMKAADGKEIPEGGLLAEAACDEEGKVTFACDVPLGMKLYAKELSTDERYVLSEESFPAEFNYAGAGTAEVRIGLNEERPVRNRLIRGHVRGVKADGDGNPVPGAVFGLFREGDEEALMTAESSEDGLFLFRDVPFGDYGVREIRAPEGFVPSEETWPISIGVDGEVIEIGFENLPVTGAAELTKVDEDYPENRLTGAEFEVFLDLEGDGIHDEGEDVLIGIMEEADTGVYRMEGLRYGSYLVHEKTAPEGFRKDEGYHPFSVTEDGETVTVETEAGVGFLNGAKKGSIRIRKTSEDGIISGITFRIEGKDFSGNLFSEERVTGEDGEILLEGLRIGEYTVSEVRDEKTAGYILPESVTLVLGEGETAEACFHNRLQPADVPDTGDGSHRFLWGTLAALSFTGTAAAAYAAFGRKRKEEGDRDR